MSPRAAATRAAATPAAATPAAATAALPSLAGSKTESVACHASVNNWLNHLLQGVHCSQSKTLLTGGPDNKLLAEQNPSKPHFKTRYLPSTPQAPPTVLLPFGRKLHVPPWKGGLRAKRGKDDAQTALRRTTGGHCGRKRGKRTAGGAGNATQVRHTQYPRSAHAPRPLISPAHFGTNDEQGQRAPHVRLATASDAEPGAGYFGESAAGVKRRAARLWQGCRRRARPQCALRSR